MEDFKRWKMYKFLKENLLYLHIVTNMLKSYKESVILCLIILLLLCTMN